MVQVVVRPHPNSACMSLNHNEPNNDCNNDEPKSLPAIIDIHRNSTNDNENHNINNDEEGDKTITKRSNMTSNVKTQKNSSRSFPVSMVLNPNTSQETLFSSVLERPFNQWLSSGQHGACFAYGFTGTGKSHSLFGKPDYPGAIVLSVHYLLENLPDSGSSCVRISIYEVDGKRVNDLLATKTDDTIDRDNTAGTTATNTAASLTVRSDEQGMVHLRRTDGQGPLTRVIVTSANEFDDIWKKASKSRRVGSSTIHDASSRTHAIVDLDVVNPELLKLEQAVEDRHAEYIEISNKKDDILRAKLEEAYNRDGADALIDGIPLMQVMDELGRPSETALTALHEARNDLKERTKDLHPAYSGSFSFIDMAGNDWEKACTVQTKQARSEHAHINSSLLAVKECFRAMTDSTSSSRNSKTTKKHIPFRRSVLTQILQRHFVGQNGRSCIMLTTIYPQEDPITLKQTMNTLRYASSISQHDKK